MKCIGCFNLDLQTLDACHRCPNCLVGHHLYGNSEWENYVDYCDPSQAPTPVWYRYIYVDCTRITTGELEDLVNRIDWEARMVQIIFLDEVHRLAERQLDERLLTPTDRQNVIWMAASVRLKGLDEMLLNRFRIVYMQKPTTKELITFLAQICANFQIPCERPTTTLRLLAERSNQITGTALQVLNMAYQTGDCLTEQMVADYVYRLDE